MRRLIQVFPEAADPIGASAAHYDRELEALNPLYDLLAAVRKRKEMTSEERGEAARLIGEALVAERGAISSIENALSLLYRSGQ